MSWLMFQMVRNQLACFPFALHEDISQWCPHHSAVPHAGRARPNAGPGQPLREICAGEDRVRHQQVATLPTLQSTAIWYLFDTP